MSVTLSAPGKLVLVGEYAVVLGHEAVVAGVGRRARCTVRAAQSLAIASTDGKLHDVTMQFGHVTVHEDTDHSLELLRCVLQEASARAVRLPSAQFVVDTSAFRDDDGVKLGIGSSAAAAVTLAGALWHHAHGTIDASAIHELARAAHLRFSQGRGSGVDVAASSFGGLVRFTQGRRVGAIAALPVDVVVVFTGHAQDTRDYLAAFEAHADKRALVPPIVHATSAFVRACTTHNASALLQAVDGARTGMAALGVACGIDVVSAPHRAIADLARQHGGAAKPSGAGGGDVALCFVKPDARAPLERDLRGAGFVVVDLALGAPGIRVD